MTTPQTDIFSLAEKRLGWLSTRQSVLAANIANASTPGYRARDVVPFQKVLANYTPITPLKTNQSHMSGTLRSDSVPDVPSQNAVRSIDRNSVSLDQQMTQISEVESAQSLVTSVWKKYASMLNVALGR